MLRPVCEVTSLDGGHVRGEGCASELLVVQGEPQV